MTERQAERFEDLIEKQPQPTPPPVLEPERVKASKKINPFHPSDVPKRTPNWLLSRLRLPKNAPFRVQNLGLRSILKGTPLPAELVPFLKRSERDIAAVRQSAAQLGADLNAAITAYAQRANVSIESAHALVAQAMETPAMLQALGDAVLKERVRRARVDRRAGLRNALHRAGSPWQNAYSESFNSRLRDELLNREIFGTLAEAKVLGSEYRRIYNEQRLHSSLDYQTPAEFARRCLLADSATLRQPKGNAITPTKPNTPTKPSATARLS